MCSIFFPLVFEVGNFLQGGLIFEYLVLPLIFVGMLLFELWERSACYLSCWGGGFSALFNICTDLVICCQSSLSILGARVQLYLQYPGFASRLRRRKVFAVGDLLVLVLVIKIVPYLRLSSCQRRLPLG